MPGTKSVGLLLSGFALLMVNTAFAEETEITNSTNSETVAYESVVSDDCAAACDECCDQCCDSGCGSCCLMGPCCLGEPISLHDELFGDSDIGITVGGWTQWGYSNESTGLFNRNPNRVQNNQSWIYAEKVADGTCGFDWGFRADLMYGTDAFVSQSFGNPPGYVRLPERMGSRNPGIRIAASIW